MEGTCLRCKKNFQIKDGKEFVSKRGMRTMKGVCPSCGTTVCRIIGKA